MNVFPSTAMPLCAPPGQIDWALLEAAACRRSPAPSTGQRVKILHLEVGAWTYEDAYRLIATLPAKEGLARRFLWVDDGAQQIWVQLSPTDHLEGYCVISPPDRAAWEALAPQWPEILQQAQHLQSAQWSQVSAAILSTFQEVVPLLRPQSPTEGNHSRQLRSLFIQVCWAARFGTPPSSEHSGCRSWRRWLQQEWDHFGSYLPSTNGLQRSQHERLTSLSDAFSLDEPLRRLVSTCENAPLSCMIHIAECLQDAAVEVTAGGGWAVKVTTQRRAHGVHYTPMALARRLAHQVLQPLRHRSSLRICDPACGGGALLIGALEALGRHGLERGERVDLYILASQALHGADLSPEALDLCELSLFTWLVQHSGTRRAFSMHRSVGSSLSAVSTPWPSRFPEVFSADRGGFDAVLANPPFLNAIEARSVRSPSEKKVYQKAYPIFAQGAYDLCLLFWAESFQHLLASDGRYGFISPTALLSSEAPWRRWVHEMWRPSCLMTEAVNAFPSARIRTTAFVGQQGQATSLMVRDGDGPIPTWWSHDWSSDGWYPATHRTYHRWTLPSATLRPLAELCSVSAGCTTAEAYELSPKVHEGPSGHQLLTTGGIDRFRCRWGVTLTRFLKRDYRSPRWPAPEEVSKGLARRISRQGPTIWVGGLSAVIEAWFDHHDSARGIVQTWALELSKDAQEEQWWALTGLLNSPAFSAMYLSRFGAASMSGKQTTIKKRSLMSTPVPEALFEPNAQTRRLSEVSRALQTGVHSISELMGLDAELHHLTTELYGMSPSTAQSIHEWWLRRAKAWRTDDVLQ